MFAPSVLPAMLTLWACLGTESLQPKSRLSSLCSSSSYWSGTQLCILQGPCDALEKWHWKESPLLSIPHPIPTSAQCTSRQGPGPRPDCRAVPTFTKSQHVGNAAQLRALQEGCWCRVGAHSTPVMLSSLSGGVLRPPLSPCKNISPLEVHSLQDMAEFGALFFCLLFCLFLNSSQKASKLAPQKTPWWSAQSGTKKCKTVSQKPSKSCKKARGMGAVGRGTWVPPALGVGGQGWLHSTWHKGA